jgi:hypothetical protein
VVPDGRRAAVDRVAAAAVAAALAAAGVPTVTHSEDLPLHLQPAVAPFLLLLRCALEPDALDEEAAVALLHSPLGGADPLAERRLRQGCGRSRSRPATGGRPASCWSTRCAIRPVWTWWSAAGPVRRRMSPGLSRPLVRLPPRPAQRRSRCCGRCGGTAVWPSGWYALSTRGTAATTDAETGRARQWRAEAADRDLDAMVVLFDAAARFVDRLPGARTEVFLEHVLGQDLPADSIAPAPTVARRCGC